jgi:hypothetical protein
MNRGNAMLTRLAAAAATLSLAATPCLAAELPDDRATGARRSGAAVGAYVRLPFGGKEARPAAGLRMTAVHDYRSAEAPRASFTETDTVELRLAGAARPTLYLAGVPVTGEEGRKHNLQGANTVILVVVIAAAAVGGYYLARAVSDSGDE